MIAGDLRSGHGGTGVAGPLLVLRGSVPGLASGLGNVPLPTRACRLVIRPCWPEPE